MRPEPWSADAGADARTARWHNHLPEWILTSPNYRSLRPAMRATLQAIADRCDRPDGAGNLMSGFGGAELSRSLGISRATWWRHISTLERHGLLVLIARGGAIRRHNTANLYAIPGADGALDTRRAKRRVQIMRRCDDGALRPEVVSPGTTPTFWRDGCTQGVVSKRDGGSLKMRRGSSQNETQPSPLPSPSHRKNHDGVSAETKRADGGRAPRRPGIGHVTAEDLRSVERLRALYDRAVTLRLAPDCEDGWRMFVGAAEHALRKGKNPPALFASIVADGRWLYVTARDEERAERRMAAEYGGGQRDSDGDADAWDEPEDDR